MLEWLFDVIALCSDRQTWQQQQQQHTADSCAGHVATCTCRYQITDKVPKAGHPDWKRVVAVIVMVRAAMI